MGMVCLGIRFPAPGETLHAAGASLRDEMARALLGDAPPVTALPGGKPVFAGGGAQFSIAHTVGCAVCAMSVPGPAADAPYPVLDASPEAPALGADVETVRASSQTPRLRRVAERFFPPELKRPLRDTPDAAFPAAFAAAWTLCESAAKRTGEGFGERGFAGLSFTGLRAPMLRLSHGGRDYVIRVCWRTAGV